RPGLFPDLPVRLDLGAEWWDETGLPFAFAVWLAAGGSAGELRRLHALLRESRAYAAERRAELAERHAGRFGLPAALLDGYWGDLTYELDAPMVEGLRTYYRLAAEIDELPRAPELRWTE